MTHEHYCAEHDQRWRCQKDPESQRPSLVISRGPTPSHTPRVQSGDSESHDAATE
jgi:hypothetical protein